MLEVAGGLGGDGLEAGEVAGGAGGERGEGLEVSEVGVEDGVADAVTVSVAGVNVDADAVTWSAVVGRRARGLLEQAQQGGLLLVVRHSYWSWVDSCGELHELEHTLARG